MNKLEKGIILAGAISSFAFSTLITKDLITKEFKNFNKKFYGLLGSSALLLGGSARTIYKDFIKDYNSTQNKLDSEYKNE